MKTIQIEATRRQGTAKTTGKPYDFISHKIVKDGKKYDVMFTKKGNSAEFGVGAMTGNYALIVPADNIWKAKGERKYPLYFISDIEDIVYDEANVQFPYHDEVKAVAVENKEDELPF